MTQITKQAIIDSMLAFYETNGRSPISNKNEIPFTKRMVQTRFGNWNDALVEAGLPLNTHKAKSVNCTECGIKFTALVSQLKRSLNSFCSNKCSCIHRNTGRTQSAATKQKISESLKAHHIMRTYTCIICGASHSNRKRKTCSKECLTQLKQSIYTKK